MKSKDMIAETKHNKAEAIGMLTFALYMMWAIMPAVYSKISAKVVFALVLIFFIFMYADKTVTRKAYIITILKYGCAGILSVYIWWTARKSTADVLIYFVNQIFVWYPLPYSLYLLTKKHSKYLSRIKILLIASVVFTCFTTIAGTIQFPLAPRLLAGAATSEEMALLFGQNIGGYGFIYAIVLLFPLIVYEIANAQNLISKILYIGIVLLIIITVVISQYLIANYMLIAMILILAMFGLISSIKSKSIKDSSSGRKFVWATLLSIVLFFSSFSGINQGLTFVFEKLDLKYLVSRTSSVVEQAQHAEEQTVLSTVNEDQHAETQIAPATANEDINNPLSARLNVYKVLFETFPRSPIIGNLVGENIVPSGHSEILDALICGGILGALLVIVLLFLIFKGNYHSVFNSNSKPYLWLMLLMVIGLGSVNTLTYSREITLICLIYPLLMRSRKRETADV